MGATLLVSYLYSLVMNIYRRNVRSWYDVYWCEPNVPVDLVHASLRVFAPFASLR